MVTAAWTTLRRGIAAACALAALAPVAPAMAQRTPGAFYPGQPVDGPSPDVRALGGIDLARDGSGALAYVRRDGGEDHAFVSVIGAGVPQPPQRIDAGQPPLVGRPAIAAGDGGRLAVVYANAAGVWAVVRAAGDQPFSPPQQLGGPGASVPAVDMAGSGTGYAVWAENGDVRAAALARRQSAFAGYTTPLDGDPARDAGTGATLRPAVGASSDGIGIAVWGERDGSGATRVVARRLVRGAPSTVAADATLASLDGRVAGSADTPDIGVEDDSSYAWVVFRQAIDDGAGGTVVRAVARRLRGSAFDAPAAIDGAPASGAVGAPRVGVNGRGAGIAVVEAPGGATLAAVIRDDAVTAPGVLGLAGRIPAVPASGFGENADGVAAWAAAPAPGAPPIAGARLLEDDPGLPVAPPFSGAVTLSDPAFGPVDPDAGFDVSTDRAGDAVIAYVQGSEPAGRRIAVGVYDRGPGAPVGTTTTNWRRASLPDFAWSCVAGPVEQHHLPGARRRPAGRDDAGDAVHRRGADRRRPAPLAGRRHRRARAERPLGDPQPAHRQHAAAPAAAASAARASRAASSCSRSARWTCARPRARGSSACGSTSVTARRCWSARSSARASARSSAAPARSSSASAPPTARATRPSSRARSS